MGNCASEGEREPPLSNESDTTSNHQLRRPPNPYHRNSSVVYPMANPFDTTTGPPEHPQDEKYQVAIVRTNMELTYGPKYKRGHRKYLDTLRTAGFSEEEVKEEEQTHLSHMASADSGVEVFARSPPQDLVPALKGSRSHTPSRSNSLTSLQCGPSGDGIFPPSVLDSLNGSVKSVPTFSEAAATFVEPTAGAFYATGLATMPAGQMTPSPAQSEGNGTTSPAHGNETALLPGMVMEEETEECPFLPPPPEDHGHTLAGHSIADRQRSEQLPSSQQRRRASALRRPQSSDEEGGPPLFPASDPASSSDGAETNGTELPNHSESPRRCRSVSFDQ